MSAPDGTAVQPADPSNSAQTGAKLVGTVAGLGAGWALYMKGIVQEVEHGQKFSFRPPVRVKTTYLLYATTIAGYFAGKALGTALYGPIRPPHPRPIVPRVYGTHIEGNLRPEDVSEWHSKSHAKH